MNLTKIKSKEAKGKQKVIPKLKAILANPTKTRCPVLDEREMEYLKGIMQNAIQESNLQPRSFATQRGICLGLESSLRKINNRTSSCVFISLTIKPNHIISLIARNAEAKDETQPVYAQPKLENFIEEIFGIQAMCMVFPKDLLAISAKIKNWVEGRKKPAKIRKVEVVTKKTFKKKVKKSKLENPNVKEDILISVNVSKACSGDFISFGKEKCGIYDSKLDNEAVNALSEIMEKIPTSVAIPKCIHKTEPMKVDSDEILQSLGKSPVVEKSEDMDSSDDFLSEYKNLMVHKIKGNPNKNPKKKRTKNKNSAK